MTHSAGRGASGTSRMSNQHIHVGSWSRGRDCSLQLCKHPGAPFALSIPNPTWPLYFPLHYRARQISNGQSPSKSHFIPFTILSWDLTTEHHSLGTPFADRVLFQNIIADWTIYYDGTPLENKTRKPWMVESPLNLFPWALRWSVKAPHRSSGNSLCSHYSMSNIAEPMGRVRENSDAWFFGSVHIPWNPRSWHILIHIFDAKPREEGPKCPGWRTCGSKLPNLDGRRFSASRKTCRNNA